MIFLNAKIRNYSYQFLEMIWFSGSLGILLSSTIFVVVLKMLKTLLVLLLAARFEAQTLRDPNDPCVDYKHKDFRYTQANLNILARKFKFNPFENDLISKTQTAQTSYNFVKNTKYLKNHEYTTLCVST